MDSSLRFVGEKGKELQPSEWKSKKKTEKMLQIATLQWQGNEIAKKTLDYIFHGLAQADKINLRKE